MSNGSIENLMGTTIEKIREMVDANTVMGDPITTADGTVLIPVSKISYGFASGGADVPTKKSDNKGAFGGGAGAGVTVVPVAFIVIKDGDAKMLQIQAFEGSTDRIIGMAPELIDKIASMFKKDKSKKIKLSATETEGNDNIKVDLEEYDS